MSVEETKHDLMLRRVQIVIAILGGSCALIYGAYNVWKHVINKEDDTVVKTIIVQQPAAQQPSALRSAVEEAGASWIKKLAVAKDSAGTASTAQ